ncbi:MAG TPA: HEAT repeat domain-containing protein [Planctomycetota bacterium]|nr:HEAT repeat domain-containing protein [Planctomycetota bacterium]
MMTVALALLLMLPAPRQDDDRIQKLIQAFGEASKDDRSRAVEELAKIGRPALDALRKATASSDLEVKGLAAQAIEKIEWVGLEKLRKYVRESLDEGASVEQSKIKGLTRWLPDTRFYEVAGAAAAAAGPAAMMGMPAPRSLFAIRKFEDGFRRLLVKGIYSANSINTLVQQSKVTLADEDAALDFVIAYMELQSAGSTQNAAAMMMGGASRLEKTADGWSLTSGMYGANVQFKTTKDGVLTEILQKPTNFNFGGMAGGDGPGEERGKLETEKLKLEIELLKHQLEKK